MGPILKKRVVGYGGERHLENGKEDTPLPAYTIN